MDKKFENLVQNENEKQGAAEVKENKEQTSLTKVVISSASFNRYDITLEYDKVVNILKKKMMVDIEIVPMTWADFLGNHLNMSRDITQDEKVALMREYYPSVLNNNNQGNVVNNLLMAKVPVEMFALTSDAGEGRTPMFWSAGSHDIKKFTSKFPQYFGSRIFTPAVKIREENGREFYCVYLCTLSTILDVLGLTVDDLKNTNTGVTIVDSAMPVNPGMQTYIPKMNYVIRFMKR